MNTKPFSVIVVESQPLMRIALRTALSAEGMTIAAELSGSGQAVHTAKKMQPDLILLAVNNPDQDDLETITNLRKTLPTTSIVALITGELHGQGQAALKHGADLVMKKSAPRSELLSALYQLSNKI